jgi:hypothetical protein
VPVTRDERASVTIRTATLRVGAVTVGVGPGPEPIVTLNGLWLSPDGEPSLLPPDVIALSATGPHFGSKPRRNRRFGRWRSHRGLPSRRWVIGLPGGRHPAPDRRRNGPQEFPMLIADPPTRRVSDLSVDVTRTPDGVLVRDSKDCGTGPVLRFDLDEWTIFLSAAVAGASIPTVTAAEAITRHRGMPAATRWHVSSTRSAVPLHFTGAEWNAFLAAARDGQFDFARPAELATL